MAIYWDKTAWAVKVGSRYIGRDPDIEKAKKIEKLAKEKHQQKKDAKKYLKIENKATIDWIFNYLDKNNTNNALFQIEYGNEKLLFQIVIRNIIEKEEGI